TGIDLAVPLGTPVFAAADGVVALARPMTDSSGNLVGYGNYIVVQHDTGLKTLYGHLLAIGVKEGDVVKRGQLIGLVGSTGNSTGRIRISRSGSTTVPSTRCKCSRVSSGIRWPTPTPQQGPRWRRTISRRSPARRHRPRQHPSNTCTADGRCRAPASHSRRRSPTAGRGAWPRWWARRCPQAAAARWWRSHRYTRWWSPYLA